MKLREEIIRQIAVAAEVPVEQVKLERPTRDEFGDWTTNIALVAKGGRQMAQKIVEIIKKHKSVLSAEVAGPGFVNISIRTESLINNIDEVLTYARQVSNSVSTLDNETTDSARKTRFEGIMSGKKIMVEYAHPNTHKELHIGHMRTLTTGEALSRLLKAAGAEVFRANYQGDIGPHVAKAIWGTRKLMQERKLTWEEAEKMTHEQKAHLLGEGYILGNQEYEDEKAKIDQLNKDIYARDETVWKDYQRTRRWSLDYYEQFYKRFGTRFDRLFFESEVADEGKKIVEANVGSVFKRSQGAIVFEGEDYGLHTRVFVTEAGTPTYEGKEMALAYEQLKAMSADKIIHVVANEQAGYFKVVIKALEVLDERFVDKETHLSMGMVQLVGAKMSSRTGVILRVDELLEQIKGMVKQMIKEQGLSEEEKAEIAEKVMMGAIKYSVLKVDPVADVAFDIQQSISIEGNSGPYLQYTYARTRSVLAKTHLNEKEVGIFEVPFKTEELKLVRWIGRFEEVVNEAAEKYKPSLLATYLYELAQRFNTFYNQHSILGAEDEETKKLRIWLTRAVSLVIKEGLWILGIDSPEKM